MEIPATFQQHPYAWGGGAAALVLLWLYSRSSSASASTSGQGTAVVSSTLDPTAAALTAQQMQDNVALTTASLQAQTQQSALTAATQINQSNNAAAVQLGSINANVVNAQTAASIFGAATSGLLTSAEIAGSGGTSINPNGGVGYVTSTQSNGYVEQNNANWQPWMNNDIGGTVPVYSTSNSAGPATNATSNQIAELFNNVIRAGQGTAPLQTVTMQPTSASSLVQTGTATIDPVFAVWDGSSATPSITDVTLNPQSQYGYTGSVFDPATMTAAQNITPNAVPAATVAQLPKLTFPPAFSMGNH